MGVVVQPKFSPSIVVAGVGCLRRKESDNPGQQQTDLVVPFDPPPNPNLDSLSQSAIMS